MKSELPAAYRDLVACLKPPQTFQAKIKQKRKKTKVGTSTKKQQESECSDDSEKLQKAFKNDPEFRK